MAAKLSNSIAAAGFQIVERGIVAAAEWPRLDTSWARRLQGNERRSITYVVATADDTN
ncbi:MAG TPA: hypothetical protein VHS05_26625 [Pyrinomonadaceae bacterium]|nr:hypothetical protein [Pyrinomonadaceae bacterium]